MTLNPSIMINGSVLPEARARIGQDGAQDAAHLTLIHAVVNAAKRVPYGHGCNGKSSRVSYFARTETAFGPRIDPRKFPGSSPRPRK